MIWRPRVRRLATGGVIAAVAAVAVGVVIERGTFRPKGPPGSPERAIAEICRPQPRDQQQTCYLGALERRIEESSVAAAMTTLKALAANDPRIENDGHGYAHGVGIKGYLRVRDVPAVFGQCPTDFASGCGHGVIQAYLESQQALDKGALNALCQPYRDPGDTQWQLFQCVHGMGHGLIMMYGGDLPEALATCDRLESGWDRESCYGGAFMENIMRAVAPHHPATELGASHEHHQTFKAIDSTDLLYPCSIVADRYHRACYEIQAAAILHFTRGEIGEASAVCDTAPEPMQPTCYSSLGRDISAKAQRDPARSARYCGEVGERHRPWCFFGAAKALIDWEAKPAAGIAFCGQVEQQSGAGHCFRAVGEQIAALGAPIPDRESACRAARTAVAVAACRWGAAIPGSPAPEDAGLVTTVFPAPLPARSSLESSATLPATRKPR